MKKSIFCHRLEEVRKLVEALIRVDVNCQIWRIPG
jgi:hypothetical protein